MKIQALRDKNFDQLENFLEFEEYIGKSYYTVFVTEFVERAKAAITTLTLNKFFKQRQNSMVLVELLNRTKFDIMKLVKNVQAELKT